MAKHLVTYDLKAPGRDYSALYNALKTFTYAKVTESDWLILTEKSCSDVWKYLWKYMDSNDALFVCALTGEASWTNTLASDDAIKKILNS